MKLDIKNILIELFNFNYRKLNVLQVWEGVVDEVDKFTFFATLYDLTHPSNSREIAELYLSNLTYSDKEKIEEGDIFYWVIWAA